MKTRIDKSTNPPTLILVTETHIRLSPLKDFDGAKRRAEERGSHYFSTDTTRYFRARYHGYTSLPDGSILIVESTKRTGFGLPDGPREYRVMRVTLTGEILHFYVTLPNGDRSKEIFNTAAKARRALSRPEDSAVAEMQGYKTVEEYLKKRDG